MKVLLVMLISCLATTFGQAPRQKQKPNPEPNGVNCAATQTGKVPTKVINSYTKTTPDDLLKVYSDGKIDVYADQLIINAYINYPGAYYGEFSGPLYFALRDEDTRQATIKKIRDNRPADFQPDMTCTVLDPVYGSPMHRNQDCAHGGPSRNLGFLKYIAVDLTYSKRGPGNIVLPPGATMPSQLLAVGWALYLASPRCTGMGAFDNTIATSIPSEDEYIYGLDERNPSLIRGTYGGSNREEFMSLFVDDPTKLETAVPGYYRIDEAAAPFLFRSIMGAVSKITEGRQRPK